MLKLSVEIKDKQTFGKLLQVNICVYMCSRKDSRYTEKDAAVVVRQMLKVAAECHLRGLVHRDMKPEVGTHRFDLMPESCRSIVKQSFLVFFNFLLRQNFLFKSAEEDSSLKATDFGLSDFIKPGKKCCKCFTFSKSCVS